MSIDSAKSYITRMREDETFRRRINDCEDEEANWLFIHDSGYAFSVEEFKAAAEQIYKERGITPL